MELDDDQFDQAINEFHSGSDRVAAIMGAALIENEILGAIKSCLPDPKKESALFYDQGAPFGTFSSKITAGRALGLYNQKVEDDLNGIRKIRNEFAHALLSISFENENILRICESFDNYVYHVKEERYQVSGARLKFERACWTISIGLLIQSSEKKSQTIEIMNKRIDDLRSSFGCAVGKASEFHDINTIVTTYINRINKGE